MLGNSHAASTPELDPLRQRQVRRVVDGVGLPSHVHLPGVGAGFSAAAGFLFSAERPADLRAAGADVHVGNAAVTAGCRQEGFGFEEVVGEDGAGQALGNGVVDGCVATYSK